MRRIEVPDYGVAFEVPDGWIDLPDDGRQGQLVRSAWCRDGSHVAQVHVWKTQAMGRPLGAIADEALGRLSSQGYAPASRRAVGEALEQDLARVPRGWLPLAEPVLRMVGLGWVSPRASRSRHRLVESNGAVFVAGVGSTRWDADEDVLTALLDSLEVTPAVNADWARVEVPSGGLTISVPGDWERYPPITSHSTEKLRFGAGDGGFPAVFVLRGKVRDVSADAIADTERERLSDQGCREFEQVPCVLVGRDGVRLDYSAGAEDERPRRMREHIIVLHEEVVVVGAGSYDWTLDGPQADAIAASLEVTF